METQLEGDWSDPRGSAGKAKGEIEGEDGDVVAIYIPCHADLPQNHEPKSGGNFQFKEIYQSRAKL